MRRGNAPTVAAAVPGRDLWFTHVIRCAPIAFMKMGERVRVSGVRAVRAQCSPIRELSCGPSNRQLCESNGRCRPAGRGLLVPLAEKSVSPGRTLDKRCYFHHTVVYLIRYAML